MFSFLSRKRGWGAVEQPKKAGKGAAKATKKGAKGTKKGKGRRHGVWE